MLDIRKILDCLPHRYPFLLVDRILEVEEKRIVGLKNVTFNEPFFQGHFPNEPVMPGVLVLEAMGQVGAVLVSLSIPQENQNEKLVSFLVTVENAKFRKPVKPGDQLITEACVLRFGGRIGKVNAVARVEGETVAEATFGFVVAKALETGAGK